MARNTCGPNWKVGSHVQEETQARSEVAKGVSAGKDNKDGSQEIERSRQKVRKKDCVRLREIQNAEVDTEVIEVVCHSSDSDVIPGFLAPDSPAPDVPLTETECMCSPWLVSQFEESFCCASGTQISLKEAQYMLQQQGRSPRVRSRGMPASERMSVPAGAPKWMDKPGTGSCAVKTDGRAYRVTHSAQSAGQQW